MSRLTETVYDATYNEVGSGSFPDNNVRAITEAIIRQFGQDVKDSFVFAYASVSSAAATLTLTHYGPHIHTGTGTTWTLPAGSASLDGKPFTWVNKASNTGTIVLKDSSGAALITIPKNVIKQGFWDNTGSRWIIY